MCCSVLPLQNKTDNIYIQFYPLYSGYRGNFPQAFSLFENMILWSKFIQILDLRVSWVENRLKYALPGREGCQWTGRVWCLLGCSFIFSLGKCSRIFLYLFYSYIEAYPFLLYFNTSPQFERYLLPDALCKWDLVLKGIVSRKLRWVKSGINRQLFTV